MDEMYECETWTNNLFQKMLSFWEELEEIKEPVSYYGRVGESVQKLYSDAVQKLPLRHTNFTDSAEIFTSSTVAFKENTGHSNINSEISGPCVEKDDGLIKKNSDKGIQEDSRLTNPAASFMYSGCIEKKYDADRSAKILNELSENYFDNRSEEHGIYRDASSTTDGSVFQDADWDIADLDMHNECVDEKCDDDGFDKIPNEFSDGDFEDLKMDMLVLSPEKRPVVSCDLVERGKYPVFPSSNIKSYKKMIKDAFMSRKKVTMDYKMMQILYADVDEDLSQLIEEAILKSPEQKSINFDWELV